MQGRSFEATVARPALFTLLTLLLPSTTHAAPEPSVPPAAPEDRPPERFTPLREVKRISLDDAVARALARSPDAVVALEDVRRGEALVEQVRAGWLPQLLANATYTRLDDDRQLNGRIILGRDQLNANLQLVVPIVSPRAWGDTARAKENVRVREATLSDTRRLVASAAARAYLTVVAQHRVLETAQRTYEVAASFEAFARSRLRGGVGNRLDAVRAAQERTVAEARREVQVAQLARAQEALGITLGDDAPIDAADVPKVSLPTLADALRSAESRSDIVAQRERAESARKAVRDDYLDYLPILSANAQPFYQTPATLTLPTTGWQAQLLLTLPLFDGGARYGRAHERDAVQSQARVTLDAAVRRARSEVRVAFETMKRADAALLASRDAAALAAESLSLAELAYRGGATTNIELVDAQRRARDAEADVAVAEDAARQARLDLLTASGRFP